MEDEPTPELDSGTSAAERQTWASRIHADAERLAQRAETERAQHRSVDAVFEMVERDSEVGGGIIAGALAYRLFIWLLPVALIAVAGLGFAADAASQSPEEAAESLVAEVAQAGGVAVSHQGDVSLAEDVTRIVEKVQSDWSRIDILVNNAGVIRDDLFVRMDPEAWDAVLKTNLGGVYLFCRAVAYPMMKQRSGRIINISSVAAQYHNMGQTNYAASKGAVNALTRGLAVELASRNVTVNAIAPGFMPTRWGMRFGDELESIAASSALQRLVPAEDAARAAIELIRNESITGETIVIDAGLLLS